MKKRVGKTEIVILTGGSTCTINRSFIHQALKKLSCVCGGEEEGEEEEGEGAHGFNAHIYTYRRSNNLPY